MLIIEGPDLIGKTTLAKQLVQQLNDAGSPHIYRHFSRLPTKTWSGNWPCQLYWSHASRHSVQDRFHMSEPLYAAIRGDESILSPDQYALLDCRLRAELGMMTVLMYDADDGELIRSRWREDEMYKLDQVLEVNAMYAELAKSSGQVFRGYELSFDCVLPLARDRVEMSELVRVFAMKYEHRQFVLERNSWTR